MNILRKIILTLAAATLTQASAVTPDEAYEWLDDGDSARAALALDSIVKAQPKNAIAQLKLGEALEAQGDDAAAIAAYTAAHQKGNYEALLDLAKISTRLYRVDDADRYLTQYRNSLKKNQRRKALPDMSGDIDAQLSRTRTMLDRVEKIVVIDSINVDAADFFRHYKISSESGSLCSTDILPNGVSFADPTVVYQTEAGNRLIWAANDADGNSALYTTDRLVGEQWDAPSALGDHLGLGGNANYPFLMPDGVTLYYASDGEGSLGGYDIFISRRGSDGFLQPQNIGMPYNSPYNDYLLVIDETTGAGWWATDRNRIPGMVTIYVFIPSDMRINVDIDDPTLADRARLSSISLTWEEGADYSALRQAIEDTQEESTAQSAQFLLPLPDGRTLTSLDDFRSAAARSQMERYLQTQDDFAQRNAHLQTLRQQYASGDTSVKQEILTIEGQQRLEHQQLSNILNEIVKSETR